MIMTTNRCIYGLFNQSIFIYIRQPRPIANTCKKINNQTQHYTNITTQTDARKGETKPLLERDICCRSSHLYFPMIS